MSFARPWRLAEPPISAFGSVVSQPLRNKAVPYGAEKYARPNLERAPRLLFEFSL